MHTHIMSAQVIRKDRYVHEYVSIAHSHMPVDKAIMNEVYELLRAPFPVFNDAWRFEVSELGDRWLSGRHNQ